MDRVERLPPATGYAGNSPAQPADCCSWHNLERMRVPPLEEIESASLWHRPCSDSDVD